MALNTIKIKQIDNNELLAFLINNLGLTLGASQVDHSYSETFTTLTATQLDVSGPTHLYGSVILESGFTSNSGIYVNGVISGNSVSFNSFNVNAGTIGSASLGSTTLTGIPIYNPENAATAIALPSGTVFGIRQKINAAPLEYNNNGDFMPALESGTTVVLLCVSVGL